LKLANRLAQILLKTVQEHCHNTRARDVGSLTYCDVIFRRITFLLGLDELPR
jgi:hypothetical protein